MGLDDRIPLYPSGQIDPDLLRYANQSPIGCRYYDASSNWLSVDDATTTTLDFRSTTGNVQYDPYNMISVANDTVEIPTPGIWEVGFEVIADQATMADGDFYMVQFGQGTFAVNGLEDLHATAHCTNAAHHVMLNTYQHTYITRGVLAAGSLYKLRGYQDNGANTARNMKIVSFSMWLRSPYIPSRY